MPANVASNSGVKNEKCNMLNMCILKYMPPCFSYLHRRPIYQVLNSLYRGLRGNPNTNGSLLADFTNYVGHCLKIPIAKLFEHLFVSRVSFNISVYLTFTAAIISSLLIYNNKRPLYQICTL